MQWLCGQLACSTCVTRVSSLCSKFLLQFKDVQLCEVTSKSSKFPWCVNACDISSRMVSCLVLVLDKQLENAWMGELITVTLY